MFFKKIFSNKSKTKMLDSSMEPIQKEDRKDFANSLKIATKKHKAEIETLVCVGDGLGIQNKMSF